MGKILAATPTGRFGETEELEGGLLFLNNNEAWALSWAWCFLSTADSLPKGKRFPLKKLGGMGK